VNFIQAFDITESISYIDLSLQCTQWHTACFDREDCCLLKRSNSEPLDFPFPLAHPETPIAAPAE
jgi:hypothetical protein